MKAVVPALTGILFLSAIHISQAADSDAVIVTASRHAETVDETLAAVTVVTRQDIERLQATTVPELLASLPGIDFGIGGGYGKDSGLYLRGNNSNHLLVLIDGMQIGSVTLGSVSLQYLPLAAIERIEIVRGPRSSLYGEDAIAGVIQIFTRQATGQTQWSADIGNGSFGTRAINAGYSAQRGDLRYHLQAGYLTSDGINAMQTNNPDQDGYDNLSLNAAVDGRLTHQLSYDIRLLRASGRNDYDGWMTSSLYHNTFLQQAAGIRLNYLPTAAQQIALALNQSRDDSEDFTDGASIGTINSTRNTALLSDSYSLGDNTLLDSGLELQREAVDSTNNYTSTSRNNTAAYIQGRHTTGPHDVQLGLRYDDNEAFGGHTTGNLGYGVELGSMRLTANYGQAYKAPSFNDLYWPGAGNPDLRPETSKQYELGLRGKFATETWQFNLYHNSVSDLIAWAPTFADPNVWLPSNINNATLDGGELAVNGTLLAIRHALSLSVVDPKDDATDKTLIYRATQTARLDLDKAIGQTTLGMTVSAQSRRFADAANTSDIPGYATVKLRGNYQLNPYWQLFGHVDNLFDRNYQTKPGYNSPGMALFAGIRYQEGG